VSDGAAQRAVEKDAISLPPSALTMLSVGFVPKPEPRIRIEQVYIVPAVNALTDVITGVGSPTFSGHLLLVATFVVTVIPYWPVLLGLPFTA
jgi:hypothetical protein